MQSVFSPFPLVMDMHDVALGWAADREDHNTDDLKKMLAGHFELGPDVLGLTLKDGERSQTGLTGSPRVGRSKGFTPVRTSTTASRHLAANVRFASEWRRWSMRSHGRRERDRPGNAAQHRLRPRRNRDGRADGGAACSIRLRAASIAERFVDGRQRAGLLMCDECGFDPATRAAGTGVHPRSLLDVHHTRPLDEGVRLTTVADFALLCPTYHRFVHALMRSNEYRGVACALRRTC